MWRKICQKGIVFGVIVVLLTISVTSVNSIEIKKNQPQNSSSTECYSLGSVLVRWGSPFHGYPLKPDIDYNFTKQDKFNFTEINGTLINMCFWINFTHFLRHDVIIPRFDKFRLAIMDEDHQERGFLYNKDFGWKKAELPVHSYNISINGSDFFRPCYTYGEDMAAIIVFEVQGFPFGIAPLPERFPVTFHPILQ